jgi:hypothetical protein
MQILSEYQTDHLLLLVGTNPLPNLVAARLLLKEKGTLYLIHSQDTALVAQRLYEFLTPDYTVKLPPAVKEAEAVHVERRIAEQVRALQGSVGLHYTGGTKVMAVHAYRAVERALERAASPPVFSYLDAGSFELRIDPEWHEKVLLAVRPKLNDLVRLHACRLQSGLPKRQDAIVWPRTAAALAQAAPNGGLQAWRAWGDDELRLKAHAGKDWKSNSQLSDIVLTLPDDPALAPAMESLKAELGLPSGGRELPLDPDQLDWPFRKRQSYYLCRWLDGEWLEQYVLAQIAAIADACQVHDSGMSLKTDRDASAFDFEFDVAAMRGYQFFGISCTTDENFAKLKLFEAFIRARHLGGDEARIGLISGDIKTDKLEQQVTQSWDAQGKIRVFGPQHLPKLDEHLTRWFQTAQ